MLAKVRTCAVVGLEGYIVEVEVDISPGLPAFTIVGLPDTAVQEARERVRAAIRNSGCEFPTRRITVNLAPADMKKGRPLLRPPHCSGHPYKLRPGIGLARPHLVSGRTVSGWQSEAHQWDSTDGLRSPRPGDYRGFCSLSRCQRGVFGGGYRYNTRR